MGEWNEWMHGWLLSAAMLNLCILICSSFKELVTYLYESPQKWWMEGQEWCIMYIGWRVESPSCFIYNHPNCLWNRGHWKRPWCWERLKTGEGDDRVWNDWMASPSWWTWVWVNSWSWWWTRRPGMLQSMRSQRVGHDWATELNWTEFK